MSKLYGELGYKIIQLILSEEISLDKITQNMNLYSREIAKGRK